MSTEQSVKNKLLAIQERAKANLKDTVLPFWTRATWDRE